MAQPLATMAAGGSKRFDSEHYVEGYATTFDAPYLLYEYEGTKYYEVVDRHALEGADLTDVIMQYNHSGTVFARNKMAKGKAASLLVEPHDAGLFIAADLGLTDASRAMYDTIAKGLISKMSWAFRVSKDSYDKDTRTRTILKVSKVYDISPVDYPANDGTEIAARSWVNGAIDAERREALARQRSLLLLKIKTEV
jgi:HK97 family phage prohead protease